MSAAPRAPVVVVGATGSVGRQVCAAFARRGHEVLGVARRPPRLSSHEFRALDVAGAAPAEVAALLAAAQAEVVVNAAGRWGPTVAEMSHAHLGVARRLLAAMATLRPRPRLVHIGSVHEYGPAQAGTLIHEALAPNPTSAYGRVKLAVSQAVLDATSQGRADGTVLRAVNMCGPHPPEETFLARLQARLRAAAATGASLEVGVADARRDFVDVRDVADAVVLAADAPVAGQAINIGRGVAVPMLDLVRELVAVSGIPPERVTLVGRPAASHGGDWTQADISKAARLLGWQPRVSLSESLRAMWAQGAEPSCRQLPGSGA